MCYGFQKLGHDVKQFDLRLDGSKPEDILDTEVCYICVPTPPKEDGSNSSNLIVAIVTTLNSLRYRGIVVIKSTVEPGTTQNLINNFPGLDICFCPEWLRERMAIADFMENHDVCIIGTHDDYIFETVKDSHGKYPKKFIKLTPSEAEMCKYFNNLYNVTLISFANSFATVCEKMGVNYTNVKNAITNREHINDIYLDSNENFKGWAGPCFPVNSKVFQYFIEKNNINVDFFKMLISENEKYKKTVPIGMRLK